METVAGVILGSIHSSSSLRLYIVLGLIEAFLFLEKRLLKNRFLKKLAMGVLLLQ
jgi:predicted house-cleaning noncanonical NTP pyrophosphatase (MazG superfamily)